MYQVEIFNKKDMTFQVQGKNHKITIDAKYKEGLSPLDILLASLGTCVGVYTRLFADKMKVPLDEIKITVQADLGKVAPYGFEKIDILLDLKNTTLDESKKNALLQFIKNCPVHQTLKINPKIEFRISP